MVDVNVMARIDLRGEELSTARLRAALPRGGVDVDAARQATIDMTLTSAACPLTDVIEDQAREALDGVVADFRINWVWMPPWGPDKITEDGREQLRALGFNV